MIILFTLGSMLLQKLLLASLLGTSFISRGQVAGRFDVVITEIMADPTPAVGLPNAEYVEIKNISPTPLNLDGWKLSDLSSTGTINPGFTLQPDSLAILCSNANVAALSTFGRTIGVTGFPSLDNEGDLLSLRSPQGRIIHALSYSADWYQNDVKRGGGWSLEMVDVNNPCGGSTNWKASIDPGGGTPGRKNSVQGVNTDTAPPRLVRTYSQDSATIIAVFDEPLDSASAGIAANYSLSDNLVVSLASPQPALFQTVALKISTPLEKQRVYTLTVEKLTDCKGNPMGMYNKAPAGIPEEASAADLVINEILFNPRPGAYDYVEVYNRSRKIIDANKVYIANRSASGALNSLKKLSEFPFSIFPGDYIVVTEDVSSLQREYFVQDPGKVFVLSSLPSFPDDKGTVVITNAQGAILDEVSYIHDWHFALISNEEGVALERIDPNDSSQKQDNWHSAASTAGYGTPTYKNSQYRQTTAVKASIEVSPHIFSPDNDGYNDVATIGYDVAEPGYVANIIIFDAGGRRVRYLVRNALLGLRGSWNWDGLDESGQKLPVGTYILYTEIFNLQGKKKQFRNTIVLARKLN